MAQELVRIHEYSVQSVCEFLDLSRSSYYYQKKEKPEAQQLAADLKLVAGQHPTYGNRRLMHQLRRKPFGYQINSKHVQRLARQMNLLRPTKRQKIRTTNSQHPFPRYDNLVKDMVVTHPDQVWVSDITYIRLKNNFIYLAVVLDVFTRSVRGWSLGYSLDQQLTLDALQMALENADPQIHHSDQGVQYAALAYVNLLKSHGVQISMASIGKAEENGYAERFMRTIKEEEVDLSDYNNFSEAYYQIKLFIQDVYLTKRIHSSLGYLTPSEFEDAFRSSSSTHMVQITPF
jgi:transposase InsO family protein